MMSKIAIVLFVVLFVDLTTAQSTTRKQAIDGRIIFGGSTSTPYPTPSMVDVQNWNFSAPSDLAKQCLSTSGQSFADYCQKQSAKDWDPVKLNTATSTTWETCCALYEEMDCYVKSAANFCGKNPATEKAVIAYSRKVAYYFQYFICKGVYFFNWKNSCEKAAHDSRVKALNESMTKNPNFKINFIDFPLANGPERTCVLKMRTHENANSTLENLERKCLDNAIAKWDPAHNKYLKNSVQESCCATYDALDCLVDQAKSVCAADQVTNVDNYRKKTHVAVTSTVCKTIPADQRAKLCSNAVLQGKGAGFKSLPSIGATFLIVMAAFVMFL